MAERERRSGPNEDKVSVLMQALADSVDAAKAARRRAESKPVHRCSRCTAGIGGCMTEGCPGPLDPGKETN